jgi:hypothetical protein
VQGEGAAQSVPGTALDNAGNTASTAVGAISIDKTAPTVTVTGIANGAIYTFGAVPAAACSTTDGLSGVLAEATPGVTGGTGVGVGQYVASCSGATDKAGNSGSASVTYSVHYAFTGFFAPLSHQSAFNPASAGTTVPVKFSLAGSFGLAIFEPASPTSTQVHCTTSAPLGAAVPTVVAGLFSYDPASGVYQYNWKTVAAWKNTCRVFSLGLNDGSTRTVKVSFK